MGMPYSLIKRDKPEIFDLGKGSVSRGGWLEVFDRGYGLFPFGFGGNFLEPIKPVSFAVLKVRLDRYDGAYSGETSIVAKRIIEWMGDDVCMLFNGREELEYMIDEGKSEADIIKEFNDIGSLVTVPLGTYTITGSVWS
jgi:hypothetical protein